MGLDLAQTHGWIVSEVARARSIAESMRGLIDQCEAAHPHPDWARLRSLPYADLSPLLQWLQRPFREEAPTNPLRGLWFGLFNPCPNGRTPVADMYVCGSERFDADPADNSWAVGPDWWPNARYAGSAVLADVYRIAYRQGSRAGERKAALQNDAEYPLCLGYAAFAVRELLGQVESSLLLGQSDSLGVAVGFDSGDFVLLGELTDQGIMPLDPESPRQEIPMAPILEALRSFDRKRVLSAIFGLERVGDRARESVSELVRLATTFEQFGVRQAAVSALAAIAPEDPITKGTVLEALKDVSPYVRREALQASISIKALSADDLARIKGMENDSDENVARWSEIALRNIRLRNDVTAEPEESA